MTFDGLPRGYYGAILADHTRALEIGKAAEHLVCADLYTFPGKFKRNRYAAIDGFPFSEAINAN